MSAASHQTPAETEHKRGRGQDRSEGFRLSQLGGLLLKALTGWNRHADDLAFQHRTRCDRCLVQNERIDGIAILVARGKLEQIIWRAWSRL